MKSFMILFFALLGSRAIGQDLYYTVTTADSGVKIALFSDTAPVVESLNQLNSIRSRLSITGATSIRMPDGVARRHNLDITSVNIQGSVQTHIACSCTISMQTYSDNFYTFQISASNILSVIQIDDGSDRVSGQFLNWWRREKRNFDIFSSSNRFLANLIIRDPQSLERSPSERTLSDNVPNPTNTPETFSGIQISTQSDESDEMKCYYDQIFITAAHELGAPQHLNANVTRNFEINSETPEPDLKELSLVSYLTQGLLLEARVIQNHSEETITQSYSISASQQQGALVETLPIQGFCNESDIRIIISGSNFSIPLSARDTALLQFKALHRNLQLALIETVLEKMSTLGHYQELLDYAGNANLLTSASFGKISTPNGSNQSGRTIGSSDTVMTKPLAGEERDRIQKDALSLEAFRIEQRGTENWVTILKEEIELHIISGDYHVAHEKIALLEKSDNQNPTIPQLYANLASAMRNASSQAEILAIMVSAGYSRWPPTAQEILSENLSGLDMAQAQTQLDGQIEPQLQSNLHFWGTQESRVPTNDTSPSLTRDQIVSALSSSADLRTTLTDTLQP